ncbi:MAG: type 2 isopentenyl-diphosphate Delta-isomerase [Chlorobiaceae bacterium]|jgi:isopentenyl-diphosphate Delta-isomerase|nr:type 2 isopentenyl-diphosphate Delta-isomerase [Chlorobiaceae bacterium]NTV16289.1 type 2 isopentenyl-diphosphate Delta-isomerase [Chlorobiaceae bacterium]
MSDNASNRTIERKHSHVEICLHGDVAFNGKTTGFERFEFEPNALPELSFSDIDISTTFLGKTIGAPLMISSMTGGYSEAATLNQRLAEAAERFRIPLGVGSMRQALENSSYRESFAIVRKYAPSIQIFANIGAPEVAKGLTDNEVSTMLDLLQADGLIVHLNAAQELFQPEGNTDFRHVLEQLSILTAKIPVPVIVKEVGCGISASVARQLIEAGVKVIDVAGAGGISWQKVEEIRYTRQFGQETRFSLPALEEFLNWGIPTAQCLLDIRALKNESDGLNAFEIIASGGIRCGIDIAKSLALGAQLAASARYILKALHEGTLEETINSWLNDLRAVMFLTGAGTIPELRNKNLLIKH